jgi:hypothetical protein
MTNAWGRDLVRWQNFQQMLTQLMTRVSRKQREQFLRVYTYTNGNEGVVVVEDFHPEESMLDLDLQVSGPNNFKTTGKVQQIAPRRYQTTVPLQGQGRYQVQVSVAGKGRIPATGDSEEDVREVAYGGFIVSYSPEYLNFDSNPIVLEEIAKQTGGEMLDPSLPPEELVDRIYGRREPKRSSRAVFDWLLMALACMIPLDVAIRRVQLDFSWVKKMFRRRGKEESSSTMGALLQRKESVRSTIERAPERAATSRPAERPLQPRSPVVRPDVLKKATAPNKDETQPTTAKADEKPAQETPDDGSTTSRLLAMKRRRETDQQD